MDSAATSGAFKGTGTGSETGSGTGTGTGGVSAGGAILEPGRVLGNRYEILAVLGQGGMGAVYKVHDREIGGYAALKVIRPEVAHKPGGLERFKQEVV